MRSSTHRWLMIALLLAAAAAAAPSDMPAANSSDSDPVAAAGASAATPAASGQAPGHASTRPHLRRCRGTVGRWCGVFQHQQPIPAKLAPAYSKACQRDCSGVGVCNAMSGQCDCPAGWTGPDCSQPQKRPCSDGSSTYKGPGTQPSSHIGPDGRDTDWTTGGWSASRCGGICDDDKGLCYCDGPEFGRVQAPPGSPPGTPPVRVGRPLSEYCQPAETKDGDKAWGRVAYSDLFGKYYGWCSVPIGLEPAVNCGCPVDGLAGRWCEHVTEQVCPNSCSGHGRCDGGFCHCSKGWFGHDCAGRVEGQAPDAFNQSEALTARPWLSGHLVPPVAAAQPPAGATRRRPLIFVYDVPAWAATRMLQYRGNKQACTWRHFEEGNTTQLNTQWVYSAEVLIHEMLLASAHRTMDPEEADLFYVPAYTACFAWPVHGWADYPWWYSAGGPRVSHMAKLLLELKQHIAQTWPYWNRTQGRDHIWLAPHDEGACWFPTEVYRNSIILTHWGRLDANHTSGSAFASDNYDTPWVDAGHRGHVNISWTELIKGHPCYTPGKDLVIPSPKFPPHYRWSPLLGAPPQPRDTLLYFRGDVGTARLPHYSRGIRQRLHALSRTPEWVGDFAVKIGTREELPGDYGRGLASSRFCLVAPGDGWSARAEDAILHGCVPVILQDDVHAPLESVLDYSAFSIRIPERDVDRVPHILQAVPHAELARLQRNLRRIWHRFAYLSQPLLRSHAERISSDWAARQQQQPDAMQQQQQRRLAEQPMAGGQEGWRVTGALGTGSVAASDQHVQQPAAAADQHHHEISVAGDSEAVGSARALSSTHSAGQSTGGALSTLLSSMQAWRPVRRRHSRRARRPGAAGPHSRFNLTEEHVQDDAFGTLMQWLYARSLQLQRHRRQPQAHRPPPVAAEDNHPGVA